MGSILWSMLCGLGSVLMHLQKVLTHVSAGWHGLKSPNFLYVQVMVYLLIWSGIRQGGLYGSVIMYWIAWYSVSQRCIWAPFCRSMVRIHFWSGFGPIWRDESCNDFIQGLSISCLRDVNVTLTLRKQLNITAGILSQDHTWRRWLYRRKLVFILQLKLPPSKEVWAREENASCQNFILAQNVFKSLSTALKLVFFGGKWLIQLLEQTIIWLPYSKSFWISEKG